MNNLQYLNDLARVLDRPIGPAISRLNEFVNSPMFLERRREKSPEVLALVKKIEEMEALSNQLRAQKSDMETPIGVLDSSCGDDEWMDSIIDCLTSTTICENLIRMDLDKKRKAEGSENGREKKEFRPRRNKNRNTHLWDTVWGKMLLDEASLLDTTSYQHENFRNRFRVPYTMFLEIVEECKEHKVFGETIRVSKIPIEFKVLVCLRVLGRRTIIDEFDENLNIGRSTVTEFFRVFVTNYAEAIFDQYVYVPEVDELNRVEETYRRMVLKKFKTYQERR
jgi:hypothetical protein